MSITSLKTGGTGLSLALDNNYMEPIATTLLSSTSNAVVFNDIPQTYKHLQIRTSVAANNSSSSIKVILNSDTLSTNYKRHFIYGNGSGVASSNGSSMYINIVFLSGTANVFSAAVTDILDYTNTNKFKTLRMIGGHDNNGSGIVSLFSGNWRSTNAITSIKLYSGNGDNFAQYSSFALYGIKAS